MKSIMIVEDEKMIRAGLCAMIANAPVTVETVIECKNGAEALRILKTQQVDVMLTDIRMPKMDGIELVRRAGKLPSPPIMVVISGYSDFDYAVDSFRQGVRDYLLKPVERERVYDLLESLQAELDAKLRDSSDQLAMNSHILRSIMLGIETGPVDLDTISGQYGGLFVGNYFAVCLAPHNPSEIDSCYCFEDVKGQMILLVPETSLPKVKNNILKDRCAGISGIKNDIRQLREAYIESLRVRKYAFVHDGIHDYRDLQFPQDTSQEVSFGDEEQIESRKSEIPTHPSFPAPYSFLPIPPDAKRMQITPEQIVQKLGAGKVGEAAGMLGRMLFLAQNDRAAAVKFPDFLEQIISDLRSTFAHMSIVNYELERLADILSFENAYEYYTALCNWMDRLSSILAEGFENQSIRRIRMAVNYVGEHFRSEINLAMVSNYVSMNYTQFSNLFKKHTGYVFSDYLKNLRLAESKRLLTDTSLYIRRVAELSGYKDDKHFMKCFKQEFGVTPGDYRRNFQTGENTDNS